MNVCAAPNLRALGRDVPVSALQAGGVPGVEALRGAGDRAPARALAAVRVAGGAGVQADAGDDRERVARVRPDRDPGALAGLAPLHEARGVERLTQQAAAVQRERHRARAVVAARAERAVVPAAVDVGPADDLVG